MKTLDFKIGPTKGSCSSSILTFLSIWPISISDRARKKNQYLHWGMYGDPKPIHFGCIGSRLQFDHSFVEVERGGIDTDLKVT